MERSNAVESNEVKTIDGSRKKSILIASDCFMPRIDGIARFLEMLIPNLSEYRLVVVVPDFPGEFVKKGDYDLHRIKLSLMTFADIRVSNSPSKRILGLLDDVDLVFTHTIGPIGSSFAKAASKRHIKLISFVHSIEWVLMEKSISHLVIMKNVMGYIAKRFAIDHYNRFDAILVPSSDVGEIFSARGIKRTKFVIPLGIDSEKFAPGDRQKAKTALGFGKDDFIVGYVGRVAREKDLLTLKHAFMSMDSASNKLLIVGEGVKSLERELKGKDIIITGKKDDIIPYLNAMDVFVMPSLTETTCLAALEAMACGIPVISTPVGSLKDYVIERRSGLIMQKSNVAALAIKLNYLKDHQDLREEWGQRAREIVVKDYDYKRTISSILRILKLYLK